jgi:acetolactate synthase-1/2/3 large subunit
MPMDIMAMQTEVELVGPADDLRIPPVDTDLVEQAAELLGNARRPMIVVGSGAIDAGEELLAVAEALQAPVMSKRNGKGIVSSEHYLEANMAMGHDLWGEADAVLAVGTRLKMPLTMWGKDEDLKLVRVDIDPEQINRICTPEVGIVGDAARVLGALADALGRHNKARTSRKVELTGLKTDYYARMRNQVAPQMAYLDVIREELPADGIFVDEVTQVGFTSWFGFPVYEPRQHITAGYQGTLGYGYATALGVVAGNPDKKVIQVSGDGGIMFNIQELATAVQYQLPLVTIIFNDRRFTNVQRQQKEWFDGRVICSDLHNPDFVALAKSFGAVGLGANDPESLRLAIRNAFKEQGPVLIEVDVTEFFPAPWQFIMMPQNRKQVCT